jgi:casein kinase II subunit alpha
LVSSYIGGGGFSKVYLGTDLRTNASIVIKELDPIDEIKIKREVKIMQTLKGGDNIVQLIDVIQYPDENGENNNTGFIIEKVDNGNVSWKKMFASMNNYDI